MNENREIKSKTNRFLFDLHDFNEETLQVRADELDPDMEPEEPPPPTFSEAEMEAARKAAFEEGRKAGIQETVDAREHKVAQLLEQVKAQFQTLFITENERARIFEYEAVNLAASLFRCTFPVFVERYGLDEIEAVIRRALSQVEEERGIAIEVDPQFADLIRERLEPLRQRYDFSIDEKEGLGPGALGMRWKDGGAKRNPEQQAVEILVKLEEVLAEYGGTEEYYTSGHHSQSPAGEE